jgi:predicted nucleic acid-binding protein
VSTERVFLLETNVLSELTRKAPHPNVLSFFSRSKPGSLCISALTLGEIRRGVAHKAKTDMRAALEFEAWAKELEHIYASRILSVDAEVASIWGALSAQRTRPIVDTLLAATALHHGLTMVTRNTADVRDTGVPLINPWELP